MAYESGHLRPEEVKYLALEGGGGKGFAYLGAIAALESKSLGVLDHVEGFAGASAGAITALFLALGYKYEQIKKIMTEGFRDKTESKSSEIKFEDFFDSPPIRGDISGRTGACTTVVPRVGKYLERKLTPAEMKILYNRPPKGVNIEDVIGLLLIAGFLEINPGLNLLTALGSVPLLHYLIKNHIVDDAIETIKMYRKRPPISIIFDHYYEFLALLNNDFGLFAGKRARDMFDLAIDKMIYTKNPSIAASQKNHYNVTFEDFEDTWGFKKLLLTGSNLSLGKTVLFSRHTTPKFPVADAVRISMSIPFAFKPYNITEIKKGWPPPGMYVDGGLWNNLPYREFDSETPSEPQTLSLRLEIEKPIDINSFMGFMSQYIKMGLLGTGETQALPHHHNRMIVLDTEGLGLLDFNPPDEVKRKASDGANLKVRKYFEGAS